MPERVWGPLSRVEHAWDALRRRVKGEAGPQGAVLHPYFGHGNADALYVRARALRRAVPDLPHPAEGGARAEAEAQGRLGTLAAMWRRFETDEVPGVTVRAAGSRAETDAEGYVRLTLRPDAGSVHGEDPRWRDVTLELEGSDAPGARASAHVLVPGADARFAVVSDIDDTIVVTGATDKLRMVPRVLTNPAGARVPFPGVAAFYAALERGGAEGEADANPVFYVSSGPWNLYDLLVNYMALQGLPLGPVFLRDFGLSRSGPIGAGHADHKGKAVSGLMDTYPGLGFVLIGDSGERDPQIYADVAEAHRGRVRAVYLRAVTEASAANAGPHVARLEALGVPVRLAPDTAAMAAHAAAHGLIARADADAVRSACAADG